MIPRGIRANNPGNIERNATRWQGMAHDQSGDPRFVVFTAPEWGIRAIARLLLTYQDKHHLDTLEKIINRWAPPSENVTSAYVKAVAAALKVPATAPVNVHVPETMRALVKAIIKHENGVQPYPDAVIDEGLRIAGIEGVAAVPAPPESWWARFIRSFVRTP